MSVIFVNINTNMYRFIVADAVASKLYVKEPWLADENIQKGELNGKT